MWPWIKVKITIWLTRDALPCLRQLPCRVWWWWPIVSEESLAGDTHTDRQTRTQTDFGVVYVELFQSYKTLKTITKTTTYFCGCRFVCACSDRGWLHRTSTGGRHSDRKICERLNANIQGPERTSQKICIQGKPVMICLGKRVVVVVVYPLHGLALS